MMTEIELLEWTQKVFKNAPPEEDRRVGKAGVANYLLGAAAIRDYVTWDFEFGTEEQRNRSVRNLWSQQRFPNEIFEFLWHISGGEVRDLWKIVGNSHSTVK